MCKSSSCGLDLHDQSAKGRLRNGQKVVILEKNRKITQRNANKTYRPKFLDHVLLHFCDLSIGRLPHGWLKVSIDAEFPPFCQVLKSSFIIYPRLYSFILLVDPCFKHFESLTVFHFIILHSTLSWPLPAAPHACDIAFRFAVLPHTTLPQQKFMCWVWRAEQLHPISKRKQLRYKSWEVETHCFGRWKNPQLLIDVSFARTQRWRRFSSRRRTLQSKDDFKLPFSKKSDEKHMVSLHPEYHSYDLYWLVMTCI